MFVQVVNPFPICNSESDIYQNEADDSNSLNEYNIQSLTNFDLENAFETGIQEIPQSILDQYIPYQSDNEPVNDALLSTTPFQQLILRDEPAISEQTPVNHTCPDIQLTNPTAGIHSSQDLRPVAVVNPLLNQAASDNQATQVDIKVDGSSSLVERQRERYQTDPAYAEGKRERQRELLRDPAYAEGKRIYINTYNRIKNQTSNKEVAKEHAVIARNQYLQSVNLANN